MHRGAEQGCPRSVGLRRGAQPPPVPTELGAQAAPTPSKRRPPMGHLRALWGEVARVPEALQVLLGPAPSWCLLSYLFSPESPGLQQGGPLWAGPPPPPPRGCQQDQGASREGCMCPGLWERPATPQAQDRGALRVGGQAGRLMSVAGQPAPTRMPPWKHRTALGGPTGPWLHTAPSSSAPELFHSGCKVCPLTG